jgi:hypothetical protein
MKFPIIYSIEELSMKKAYPGTGGRRRIRPALSYAGQTPEYIYVCCPYW